MDLIQCRQRLFLPFEQIQFMSGVDFIHIEYVTNGEIIKLYMYDDSSTLYRYGNKDRAYVVGKETFEKIASVIEKYGIVEE